MRSFLYLTSCIAAALAAPASWTPEMAAFYSETSALILKARALGQLTMPTCDLSKVNITAYLATIPDSPPIKDPGNARLLQVTVGRGVQNYTCADDKDTTKPKAIGAVANLFNMSCVAANYPNLMTLISPFAVQYNNSLEVDGKLMGFDMSRSGHHYFNSNGAPVFDLNDHEENKLGLLVADGKNPEMKVDAPKSAVKGQVLATNGQTGAVAWLKLNKQDGTTNNLAFVYRVNTAGGVAPATCAGQPSVISVPYAAEYWFFASS